MSEKEKAILDKIAKLPEASREKLLFGLNCAAMAIEDKKHEAEDEEANNGDDVERAAQDA